jgi:membrane-bound serine protease (ClpP class)
VIFVIGLAVAIFVVPDGWTIPVILGAAGLEVAETLLTWGWSRRGAPKVGPETLIGSTGRVIEACRPDGTVRVHGEVWRARCDAGADPDDLVRVVGREGLLLVVEVTAADSPPAERG